jgi:hypothetical protein
MNAYRHRGAVTFGVMLGLLAGCGQAARVGLSSRAAPEASVARLSATTTGSATPGEVIGDGATLMAAGGGRSLAEVGDNLRQSQSQTGSLSTYTPPSSLGSLAALWVDGRGDAYAVYDDQSTVTVQRSPAGSASFATLASTPAVPGGGGGVAAGPDRGDLYLLGKLAGSAATDAGELLSVTAAGQASWSAAPSSGWLASAPDGSALLLVGGLLSDAVWTAGTGSSWTAVPGPPGSVGGGSIALGQPLAAPGGGWWVPAADTTAAGTATSVLSLSTAGAWSLAPGSVRSAPLAIGQPPLLALQAAGPWYASTGLSPTLYRSTDQGASWQSLATGPASTPSALVATGSRVLALVDGELCASKSEGCTLVRGVWESKDAGDGWDAVDLAAAGW